MKKLFCFVLFVLTLGATVSAQPKVLKTINLSNGITFNGYVEPQMDGGYKVTTETGDIFYYSRNDVASVKDIKTKSKTSQELKYHQYKHLYNSREYQHSIYDKYDLTSVTVWSCVFPGVGNFMVGQYGLGIMCSTIAVVAVGCAALISEGMFIGPGVGFYLLDGLFSSLTARKRAKITNVY